MRATSGRTCAESSRGAPRDAATLFDESGVIVASADASLAEALSGHRWREVFVDRRPDLDRSLRFIVFGHAVYDQLRAPFFGLCGKALFVALSAPELASPRLLAELDERVAGRFADPAFLATPRDLSPLPLLGIPGVTDDKRGSALTTTTRGSFVRCPSRADRFATRKKRPRLDGARCAIGCSKTDNPAGEPASSQEMLLSQTASPRDRPTIAPGDNLISR